MQGKSGNLPGECATLVGDRVCAPRVEVDGTRLSDLAVLQGVVGIVGNPEGRRVSLNSLRARRAGIALAVFHQLVAVEARRDHVTVTRSQARALAEKELGFYERTPPTERGQIYFNVIPAGSSPRAYFLSSRMIALYRHGMVIGTERDMILHHYSLLPEGTAFRRWFASRLPHYTITINGSPPTFSLPAALPAGV